MSASSPTASPWLARLANAAVLLALLSAVLALLSLQGDPWWIAPPRPHHWWIASASVVAYAGLCAWAARRDRIAAVPGTTGDAALQWLVVHASQTGFALDLAERTSALLREAGVAHAMLPLGHVDAARLTRTRHALFIASTTGEGDPPDQAMAFVSSIMSHQAALGSLAYGVLALGDRSYAHYCGFGHQLDDWLRRQGARPLFDLIEVDNGDPAALRHWQRSLAQFTGRMDAPDWSPPDYAPWILSTREVLNPGSLGAAVFRIALTPPPGAPSRWQAGDVVEIGPCNPPAAVDGFLAATGLPGDAEVVSGGAPPQPLRELLAHSHLPAPATVTETSAQALAARLSPLPHREYSIASLPEEGRLELLVRRMLREDGTPGLGSGWLCDHARIGTPIAARVRVNRNFHAPPRERPMILIGNGTGIAGLRTLLAERIRAGAVRNWLLFGERQAAADFFFRDDLLRWQAEGGLERFDAVFSRDGKEHRYVQEALAAADEPLHAWIDEGASVYVCGGSRTMAPAVDAVLRTVLGNATVERLLAEGRYRRDVY